MPPESDFDSSAPDEAQRRLQQYSQLAARVDAALKQLPVLPAPNSLPREVLAAIAAREARPWWRRAWWEWPGAARTALIASAAAMVLILAATGLVLGGNATEYSRNLTDRVIPSIEWPAAIGSLCEAADLLWEKAVLPQILHLGLGMILLYLLCIGLGTACFRLAQRSSGSPT